jgi:hypothetical protein
MSGGDGRQGGEIGGDGQTQRHVEQHVLPGSGGDPPSWRRVEPASLDGKVSRLDTFGHLRDRPDSLDFRASGHPWTPWTPFAPFI